MCLRMWLGANVLAQAGVYSCPACSPCGSVDYREECHVRKHCSYNCAWVIVFIPVYLQNLSHRAYRCGYLHLRLWARVWIGRKCFHYREQREISCPSAGEAEQTAQTFPAHTRASKCDFIPFSFVLSDEKNIALYLQLDCEYYVLMLTVEVYVCISVNIYTHLL